MGYTMADGRYANTESVNLLASGARTVTAAAYGPVTELGDRSKLRAKLVVTAKSGTMTSLDVSIETSQNGTDWYTAVAFTQVGDSATATERKVCAVDRFVRVKYVIVGSNNYTFAVLDGEAS
jgi:hypothetical protein